MRRGRTIVALAFVASLLASVGVNAATVSFGAVSIPFSATIGQVHVGGAFVDQYTFTPTGSGSGAAAVFRIQSLPTLSIANFAISLKNLTTSGSVSGSTVGDFALLSATVLANNNYSLRVSGLANGTGGGAYTGALSVVPIPAALPLFLTALAGVALISRRRSAS